MKGKLITIYGINNIGKTTQSKILVRKLKQAGYKAIHIKYPQYEVSPSGEILNNILRNKDGQKISEDELQLWFVLNRYQYQPTLRELLEEGFIVIAEDYIGTGIAWGMAKGLEEEWLENCNKNLLQADYNIILQGERSLHAKEAVHVHEQDDELAEKSRKIHEYLAEKYEWEKVQIADEVMKTAAILFEKVEAFLEKVR